MIPVSTPKRSRSSKTKSNRSQATNIAAQMASNFLLERKDAKRINTHPMIRIVCPLQLASTGLEFICNGGQRQGKNRIINGKDKHCHTYWIQCSPRVCGSLRFFHNYDSMVLYKIDVTICNQVIISFCTYLRVNLSYVLATLFHSQDLAISIAFP